MVRLLGAALGGRSHDVRLVSPQRPDAATPAHMRGIRRYEPRMRLLFGIEPAALAHAADGRVLGPLRRGLCSLFPLYANVMSRL